ncbi:MAG: hypothetical protein A2543_01265 [Candidatus Komeilibacteria bacterium RIFOXYD2_FULL_37_8]|nr:MAG: hypothetical protein A2611_03295 [Candidatus Komeilibacteria bacterium RIFOXYD1_FULL_37_29]OGY96425.1 MAG: hypothetical protein A2543_01265 [Candidatus Komeilibacteria bacterium RIFOXYD2_FULL_37_8]
MILQGIDFGNVFLASGALNFFGEGWPYHRLYKIMPGFDFSGATFISKTTTLYQRTGNMPLTANLQPKQLMPVCIKVYPFRGVVLNSVGLSGPGVQVLLNLNQWQKIQEPFLLSFMAVDTTPQKREEEIRIFTDLLRQALSDFLTPIGLEINISCPNTQHNPNELIKEVVSQLEIASKLRIPLMVKLNVLASPHAVKEICDSGLCDGIECSNTIPWGQLPDLVHWNDLFGVTISPLAKLGGGGLSGWPLVEIVTDWIKRVRDTGITIPIIAGGGIGCRRDYRQGILAHQEAGANGISIGTAMMIRPWRIRKIIDFGNKVFGN